MKLNDGEVKCSKCEGTGKEPKSKEDCLIYGCEFCGGTGKVDWVENAMKSIKNDSLFHAGNMIASFNPTCDITFYTDGNTESLRLCGNGDFIVKGKKLVNDKKLYEGFVDFLKDAGYYI